MSGVQRGATPDHSQAVERRQSPVRPERSGCDGAGQLIDYPRGRGWLLDDDEEEGESDPASRILPRLAHQPPEHETGRGNPHVLHLDTVPYDGTLGVEKRSAPPREATG